MEIERGVWRVILVKGHLVLFLLPQGPHPQRQPLRQLKFRAQQLQPPNPQQYSQYRVVRISMDFSSRAKQNSDRNEPQVVEKKGLLHKCYRGRDRRIKLLQKKSGFNYIEPTKLCIPLAPHRPPPRLPLGQRFGPGDSSRRASGPASPSLGA